MNFIEPQSQIGSSSMAIVDPAAVAAAESSKARIQAAYQMALYRPRNYDQARVRILSACRRPTFAAQVEYSKPIGGSAIKGPSIRFAELALREWGNITYENQVVYDGPDARRVRVTVVDLETNTTFGKEIQVSKTIERKFAKDREVLGERQNSYGETVYLVKATDDELLIREAALISKALRNEGLRLIPQEIIEEAMAEARKVLASDDAKDPDAARKRICDLFAAQGVMPAALSDYLGHPIAQCAPAELLELRTIYNSLRSGEATWADYTAKSGDEPSKADETRERVRAAAKANHQPTKGQQGAVIPTAQHLDSDGSPLPGAEG